MTHMPHTMTLTWASAGPRNKIISGPNPKVNPSGVNSEKKLVVRNASKTASIVDPREIRLQVGLRPSWRELL